MYNVLLAIILWLLYNRQSESQPDYRAVWKLKVDEQSGHEVFTTQKFVFPKSWRNNPGVSMSVVLTSNQKVTASVEFKDRKGNVAIVDGVPEWLTDNSDLLELVPSADGKTCDVIAKGMVGNAKVTCLADAKVGDGVQELRATGEVLVQAGQAITTDLVFGPVAEQEETVPPVPDPVPPSPPVPDEPAPPVPTPDEPAPTPPPSV